MAGVDYILNVVINKERQLAGVFGGHYDLAHQAGCKLVAEHAVANLAEKNGHDRHFCRRLPS